MLYEQYFQYEAPKYDKKDGKCKRDGVIQIVTDESGLTNQNDEDQQDATYLAVYYPFLPADLQKKLNFDTSKGKKLLTN